MTASGRPAGSLNPLQHGQSRGVHSGAFSQLWKSGGWHDGPTPRQYAARIHRYADEIGHLAWASPQDHMCEPQMLARTGLTIERRLELTVGN